MKVWKEGDRSKAVCDPCGKVVDTVMHYRDLPVHGKKGFVQSVLVGVCSECDAAITIAPQDFREIRRRDPVVAICGSMAFIDEMEAVARELEVQGCKAMTPVREEHGKDWGGLTRDEAVTLKRNYVDIHLQKIRDCDAVLIANYSKHGVAGYVGPNTLMEAAFAHALGIPVMYLHDPFEQASGLECASISDGCLNGDLERVKSLMANP